MRIGHSLLLLNYRQLQNLSATGGNLVIKVNDLSSYTVITAGITWPFCFSVLELYSFIKSIMGTPCCPRAGPTGGAGVASPAGRFNFILVFIFLAIIS